MPAPDPIKDIKNGIKADWAVTHPGWTVTLEVGDDYRPTVGKPTLLVADDGGTAVLRGPWMVRKTPRRRTIRLTGFAVGRDEALAAVNSGADFILTHKPGISRVEDVSDPFTTKDRATGAILASITMPVIVRPITS